MLKPHYRYLNDEPGDTGGTDTAPPAPAPAPAEPPAPAPADPHAAINAAFDAIGKPEEPETPDAPADIGQAAIKAVAPDTPATSKDIDLTPPDGIGDRAKERWAALTERAKAVPDLERRATEAETRFNSVRDMVADSGLQPDEFTNILNIGKLFKSNTPEDLQGALTQLDTLRADVAERLGITIPGIDPLAEHPDLKAEVEAMGITQERALEIAKLRQANKRTEQATRNQQSQQQFTQKVQQTAQAMDDALAARAATPGHVAKLTFIKNYFGDKAKLQKFVTTYQPEQWQAAITMMYDSYTPPAAPSAPAVQPLRPSNTGMGSRVNTKPVGSEQAVSNAFAHLGL